MTAANTSWNMSNVELEYDRVSFVFFLFVCLFFFEVSRGPAGSPILQYT